MQWNLIFEGTPAEFELAVLARLGDQALLSRISELSATLAAFGQKQEAMMADLNQQTADMQVIIEALNQANATLGNVRGDTTTLLDQAQVHLARIAELETLIAALPAGVDTTALNAAIAVARDQATVLLNGLTDLDNRVPAPAPAPVPAVTPDSGP